jgi:hypothetical protein
LRIFQSGKLVFHPKLSVFDHRKKGTTAIIGSSNLTDGGMSRNYEANVFINDQGIAKALLDYLEEHLEGAHHPLGMRNGLERTNNFGRVEKNSRGAAEEKVALRADTQLIPFRIRAIVLHLRARLANGHVLRSLSDCAEIRGEVTQNVNAIARSDCAPVHGEIMGGRRTTESCRERTRTDTSYHRGGFFKILSKEKRLRRH